VATLPQHRIDLVPNPVKPLFDNSKYFNESTDFDSQWQPLPPNQLVPLIMELVGLVDQIPKEEFTDIECLTMDFQDPIRFKTKSIDKEFDEWVPFETPEGMFDLINIHLKVSRKVIKRNKTNLRKIKKKGGKKRKRELEPELTNLTENKPKKRRKKSKQELEPELTNLTENKINKELELERTNLTENKSKNRRKKSKQELEPEHMNRTETKTKKKGKKKETRARTFKPYRKFI